MGPNSIARAICDMCHENQPCIYCCSDAAFLCSDCDLHVHSANFLVARHIRLPLCSLCKSYHDHRSSSSSCNDIHDHNNDDALSSSSSSTECISSTDTKTTTKTTTTSSSSSSSAVSSSFDWKTRDLLMNWCVKLGVRICASNMNKVMQMAQRAFQVWWLHRTFDIWPYRMGLAACLWLGLLRFTKDNNNEKITRMCNLGLLKRLADISGVPAKSIVVTQSKLVVRLKHRREIKEPVDESWDEC